MDAKAIRGTPRTGSPQPRWDECVNTDCDQIDCHEWVIIAWNVSGDADNQGEGDGRRARLSRPRIVVGPRHAVPPFAPWLLLRSRCIVIAVENQPVQDERGCPPPRSVSSRSR